MVQRERIADNIYSFQSSVYAKVNAGAIICPDFVVVIDTLALPEEAYEIREFIEQTFQLPIRYLINTHHHADHSWGNCFFPGSTIISHKLTSDFLATNGRTSLDDLRRTNISYRNVKIVLPHITFSDGFMEIRIDGKNLRLFRLPGHSIDNIGVLLIEDSVMFAGDVAMPIPYIVDGNIDQLEESLKFISEMGLESMIQGHGEVVLRGEVGTYVEENLDYLDCIRRAVKKSSRRKYPLDLLRKISIQDCGKSRVTLGGSGPELHLRNLKALYKHTYGELPLSSMIEDEDYP